MEKIYWKDVANDMGVIEKDEHYETEDGKIIYWHVFEANNNFNSWIKVKLINTKRKNMKN